MPLYELFCLARSNLSRANLTEIIKTAATQVLDRGGVVTDIRSYGRQHLGYAIRKPHNLCEEAQIWQLEFMCNASVLSDMEHSLRVNEGVLRWTVLKRPSMAKLPKLTKLFQDPRLLPPSAGTSGSQS